MKRIITLAIFILLVFPAASSATFDWVTGRDVLETTVLSEKVTCNFYNSGTTQKCYTDDGTFSCTGTSSCTASVSGEKDKQLAWKSSCSGEAATSIDGNDKNIGFKCEQLQLSPTPAQPAVEEVRERIKCLFLNSASTQKCYTIDWKFSCVGTENCELEVYGGKGNSLIWKSSCGSEFSTVLDGAAEELSFKCEQAQPTSTTTTPAVEIINEQVKCIFANSKTTQKCYSKSEPLNGAVLKTFSCSGVDSCVADIAGWQGAKLIWSSTCSGYGITLMDKNNDEIKFNCETAQYPTITPQPIPKSTQPVQAPVQTTTPQPVEPVLTIPTTEQTKEAVKCIFSGSDSGQFCYTDDKRFGCKGIGTCVVELYGKPTEKLNWRSSCEGSFSTVVDGVTDYIAFKCSQAPSVQPTQPVQALPAVKEKVKCLFVNAQTQQQCINEYPGSGCTGIGSCIDENVVGEQGKKMVWKSSCGGYAYTVMDSQDEYVEFICPQLAAYQPAQEQVTCVFANADSPQKCYSDDGKFSCSSTGEDYTNCKADVSGAQGQKLTWKSSCGGYGYTVIDGNAEKAEFQCIPSNKVRKEQISGKGFKGAYWQCYDGVEKPPVVSASPACKPSEAWQQEASEFCNTHCHEYTESGVTKCGVNSFSVTESCYVEYGKEGVEFVPPEPEHTFQEETISEGFFKPNDGTLFLFYRENCPQCEGMEKVLDEVGSKLGVSGGMIDAADTARYETLLKEMDITAVPAFVYKRSDERFIKYLGKADAATIINWLTGKETAVEKSIEKEKTQAVKEEILFCKDSCPREGKCYPFGYRKEGKFCSDLGAFTDQLHEDSACDNNFECSTNVCIDGKCMSSGLIQKFVGWFKKLFGREEAKGETAKVVDCGASSDCMENAFKACKPAKITEGGGSVTEIVGLEGKKCVLKITAGTESMTCKIENYALGTKNVGPMEQYCEGELVKKLASAPKMMKAEKAPEHAPATTDTD